MPKTTLLASAECNTKIIECNLANPSCCRLSPFVNNIKVKSMVIRNRSFRLMPPLYYYREGISWPKQNAFALRRILTGCQLRCCTTTGRKRSSSTFLAPIGRVKSRRRRRRVGNKATAARQNGNVACQRSQHRSSRLSPQLCRSLFQCHQRTLSTQALPRRQ